MGYVTVAGATGLTLGLNQDTTALMQDMQQNAAQNAQNALNAINEGIPRTEITALEGDGNNPAWGAVLAAQAVGVVAIDGALREDSGGSIETLAGAGTYDASAGTVEIGSETGSVLDQSINIQGGSGTTNVMDGDAGTVVYAGGSGNVDYYAAAGDTFFLSGAGQDVIHTMGGTDTIVAYDSTPTVTGDWTAPALRALRPRSSAATAACSMCSMALWCRIPSSIRSIPRSSVVFSTVSRAVLPPPSRAARMTPSTAAVRWW